MAKTIAQLRTEAQTIKNETAVAANTATRVGGTIEDVVDYLDTEVGGGTFATGEEIGDVSIFDASSALTGKTDVEKQEMIPSGKVVEEMLAQGGTANIVQSLEVVALDKDSPLTPTPANGYINKTTSAWSSSSNMRTWQITNANYTRVKVHVRNTDASSWAVSFYNSSTISQASLISGYAFSGTDWDDFDLVVPNGTQLICVTTRSSYLASTTFSLYSLKVGEVQGLDERVTCLETDHAISPVGLVYYIGGFGWNNSNQWQSYANLVGDPNKHLLSDYLINGKLCIVLNYAGANQVKCKIPWFKSDGSASSYQGWTVLSQGDNWFTPNVNAVYFSICFGMNNSGGTEINASDVSLYEGIVFYRTKWTNHEQITDNIDSIQNIEHRLDVADNYGNPLYIAGSPLVYNKTYYGRRLNFEKRFKIVSTNIATGGNQGGAVYNDTLFVFNANHKNCFVVDLPTMTIIQNIVLTQETNFHCNCVNFGVSKADSGDEYPLLYVDGLYTKTCYVYRITGTRGAYSLTKMQTITYPSAWSHPEMFIDRDRNTMWVGEETSNVILRRMAIPQLSDGDITLLESNVLDTIDLGSLAVLQGGSIYNGDLYLGVGYTGGGITYVVDLYFEKKIVTMLSIGFEPQEPFIWGKHLYILDTGSIKRVYNT